MADQMGKRVTDLSVARRDLIRKGLLYAPERPRKMSNRPVVDVVVVSDVSGGVLA